MPAQQFRRFALTFYSKPDFIEHKDISYFLSNLEICPSTKKEHYQSYISMTKRYTVCALKKLLCDNTVHIESCKGSELQNIEYCKKDGKLYREFGKPKIPGDRTDIKKLRNHFKIGKRKLDAIEDDDLLPIVAKYPRLCNDMQLYYAPKRNTMTELYIFWGITGSGKSHRALQEAGDDVYYKPVGSQWWDGYEQNESVIIEDFRGQLSLDTILRLVDKYAMRVPYKGGHAQFNTRRVYITSNLNPDDWWNHDQKGYQESYDALTRRITKKVHFSTFF